MKLTNQMCPFSGSYKLGNSSGPTHMNGNIAHNCLGTVLSRLSSHEKIGQLELKTRKGKGYAVGNRRLPQYQNATSDVVLNIHGTWRIDVRCKCKCGTSKSSWRVKVCVGCAGFLFVVCESRSTWRAWPYNNRCRPNSCNIRHVLPHRLNLPPRTISSTTASPF